MSGKGTESKETRVFSNSETGRIITTSDPKLVREHDLKTVMNEDRSRGRIYGKSQRKPCLDDYDGTPDY